MSSNCRLAVLIAYLAEAARAATLQPIFVVPNRLTISTVNTCSRGTGASVKYKRQWCSDLFQKSHVCLPYGRCTLLRASLQKLPFLKDRMEAPCSFKLCTTLFLYLKIFRWFHVVLPSEGHVLPRSWYSLVSRHARRSQQ